MMVKTSLNGLKHMAHELKHDHDDHGHKQDYAYTPMLMPAQTEGKPVMKITTRQDYLDKTVGLWRRIQVNKGLGLILGVASLFLLSISPLFAGACAVLAGWIWGDYVTGKFYLYQVDGKRELLEGT
ncbi:hypothetical protein HUU53_02120 [Candidatus Micrarchaeota archaeon]|nr:hypothetical protein [Candidatus Micrarchaeota archaeon]